MGGSTSEARAFRVPDKLYVEKWASGYELYHSLPNSSLLLPSSYSLDSSFLDCRSGPQLKLTYPPTGPSLLALVNSKEVLSQGRIWKFLLFMTEAASAFEANGQRIGSQHPQLIFSGPEDRILMTNKYTTPDPEGIRTLLPSGAPYYLSPEELDSYKRCLLFSQRSCQSDTFSIGMTILSLGIQSDLSGLYDLTNCTVNMAGVAQALEGLGKRYNNPFLLKTVGNMVEQSRQYRPTPGQVACLLKPYRTQILGGREFKADKAKSKAELIKYHQRTGLA